MSSLLSQIDVHTLSAEERKKLYQLARQAASIDIKALQGKFAKSTEVAKELVLAQYRCCEREVFGAFFLNSQYAVLGCEDIFFGTIDRAAVYPREVVKLAFKYNAAAVLLFHNHPSWDNQPSPEDKAVTDKLISALDLINVGVLDHLVIGGDSCASFAERGLLR